MKSLIVTTISVLIVALSMSGCGKSFRSSGFADESGGGDVLPSQIPQQVAVLSFGGDPGVAARATRVFREGLFILGFEIVTPDSLPSIMKISHDGIPEVSPILLEAYSKVGVNGVFVGSVERQTKGSRVKTRLQVKLILIDSHEVIWRGMERDPKLSWHDMDPLKSVERSTQRLLVTLGDDIKELSKRNKKAAKKAAKNVADQQE